MDAWMVGTTMSQRLHRGTKSKMEVIKLCVSLSHSLLSFYININMNKVIIHIFKQKLLNRVLSCAAWKKFLTPEIIIYTLYSKNTLKIYSESGNQD